MALQPSFPPSVNLSVMRHFPAVQLTFRPRRVPTKPLLTFSLFFITSSVTFSWNKLSDLEIIVRSAFFRLVRQTSLGFCRCRTAPTLVPAWLIGSSRLSQRPTLATNCAAFAPISCPHTAFSVCACAYSESAPTCSPFSCSAGKNFLRDE